MKIMYILIIPIFLSVFLFIFFCFFKYMLHNLTLKKKTNLKGNILHDKRWNKK
jgi:hypothetical protein